MKMLSRMGLLFVAVLTVPGARAATYYVDYVNGSDSNNGTSETAAWKHAPGMQGLTPTGSSTGDGCSAKCASYAPAAGDEIILRGGVVWPYTTAPWIWTWSGSSSTQTYGCAGSGCIYVGNAVGAGLPAWNTGTVTSITLKHDFGGWSPSSPPTISCSGGGGSGAGAAPLVVPAASTDPNIPGFIYHVNLTSSGSGYTSAPTCTLTGGSGTATLASDIDRAIFDLGAKQGSPADWPLGKCTSYPNTCQLVNVSGNYVIFSGIEVRNALTQNDTGSGADDELQPMFGLGATNDTASNMYVHGLFTDCYPSGSCNGEWEHWGIGLYSTYEEAANDIVENGDAVALGTSTGQSNGVCSLDTLCTFGAMGIGTGTGGNGPDSIHGNSVFSVTWNLRLLGSNTSSPFLSYDNDFWLTLYQFDTAAHENDRYMQLQGGTELVSYDNFQHNEVSGTSSQIQCQNNTYYYFNEVVWGIGTGTLPYSLYVTTGGCSLNLYNDTMYSNNTAQCVNTQGASSTNTVVMQNLHCIASSAPNPFWGTASGNTFENYAGSTLSTAIQASSVVDSLSTVNGEGYTALFAPTASTNDSVTFASGSGTANLTSLCSGNFAALCSDINGNARPASGGWQAGAYQLAYAGPPVSLMGVTNTQAVLTYTAPDSGTCTLEVSQSATYSPLVPDVDPTLFSGSDTDTGGATSRFWVVGKRTVATASDSNNYSRALEANTLHYYQLTCSNGSTAGTFTTSNIANGDTFEDKLPTLMPTVPDTAAASFVDPLTGALIERFGLDSDTAGGQGSSKGWDAGAIKMCAYTLYEGGFLCAWPTQEGFTRLYWINPSTGQTLFLGSMSCAAGSDYQQNYFGPAEGNWDPSDPTSIWFIGASTQSPSQPVIIKATFTGSLTNQAQNTIASYSCANYTPVSVNTLSTLISSFDSTYWQPTWFQASCGMHGVQVYSGHTYAMVACRRWFQNSPGYLAVVDLGNKEPLGSGGTLSVVAGTTTYGNACRWCGHHSTYYIEDQPTMYWIPEALGPGQDTGAYEVSLTADVISSSATSFSVSGEPATSGSNVPPDGGTTLQNAATGDEFYFEDGTNELIQITNKVNSTSWTVARGCHTVNSNISANETVGVLTCDGTNAATHLSGAKAYAYWANTANQHSTDIWWNFLNDPHGTDLTNTNMIVDQNQYGGHRVTRTFYTSGVDVMENNAVRIGAAFPTLYGDPTSLVIQNDAFFDGISGFANGESYAKHPSYDQADAATAAQTWYMDSWPFGFTNYSDTVALVGGKTQTYQYTLGSGNTFNIYKLPYFGVSGGLSGGPSPPSSITFTDISGPSSSLSDTSAGDYEMCVAHAAGECISGSSAGNIYFNTPQTLMYDYCFVSASGTPASGQYDMCIQNTAAFGQAVDQFGMLAANETGTQSVGSSGSIPVYGAGLSRRLVEGGYAPYRLTDPLANVHMLPDASWAVYQANVDSTTQYVISALMAKIPPQPPNDGKDRTNFIPIAVPTVTGVAGATQVVADFGDDPANFYCTQRAEGCRATSSTYNASQPFYFKTTDTYSGVTPGQNIIVPCKPEHVVYYRVVYLDSGGSAVQTGAVQVALDQLGNGAGSTSSSISGATISGMVKR